MIFIAAFKKWKAVGLAVLRAPFTEKERPPRVVGSPERRQLAGVRRERCAHTPLMRRSNGSLAARRKLATTNTQICHAGTIVSKINGTPKGGYLPISKLHSILAAANLLSHYYISQICYCCRISLQRAEVNCSFF